MLAGIDRCRQLQVLVSVSVLFITLRLCVYRSDVPDCVFATVNINPKPVIGKN